tara:strand:- start:9780 stop:10031 length:252 start_codon:yes stop_codon:yes gene_type:complete
VVLASCAVLCTRASSARAEDLQRGSTSNSIGRSLLAGSKYDRGDDIALFANKVGPFHNPSEVRARGFARRHRSGKIERARAAN